jgi:hypothetical protein
MSEPLVKGELLEKQVLRKLSEPIRHAPVLEASLKDLVHSVKAQGLGEPGPPPAVALGTTFGMSGSNADYALGLPYRTHSAQAIGAVARNNRGRRRAGPKSRGHSLRNKLSPARNFLAPIRVYHD